MSSEDRGGHRVPRRKRYEDDSEDHRSDARSKSHREYRAKQSRRSHSRERSPRRRSRSPDFRDRRSGSYDGGSRKEKGRGTETRRQRDRDRDNDTSSGKRRGGERSFRDGNRDGGMQGENRDGRTHHTTEKYGSSTKLRPADNTDGEKQEVNSGRSLVKRGGPLPSQNDTFAISTGEEPEKPVEKPNYGVTGVLAAASNTVTHGDGSTVTLKYHEPPEARKPSPRDVWKLFVFKGPDIIDTIELSTRSCWLIGRDSTVVDLPAEHPSISKQHAVIQFRYTEKRNEYGDKIGRVKPYLIDLESGNGTILDGEKIPDSRYLELKDKDMIQFGSSTREYVIMLAPRS
jgi:smad nuclear-interacting protein 1